MRFSYCLVIPVVLLSTMIEALFTGHTADIEQSCWKKAV
jgi:hypothetical protein